MTLTPGYSAVRAPVWIRPQRWGQAMARASRRRAPTWDHLRRVAFLGMLTLLWLTPNPNAVSFKDDPTAGRDGTLFIQIIWPALLVLALVAVGDRWRTVHKQFDATVVLLFAWCALTTVFALDPDVSMRRLAFTLSCMGVMALTISGIKRLDTVMWLLLAMCTIETIVKYVVVIEFPSLGRHLATGAEPQLAGLWKGQYAHKNYAGPVCAFELMILYAARRAISPLLLAPLALAQAVFLIESGSKTPTFLLLGVMLLAKFLVRLRSGLSVWLTVLAGLAALNVVTLASVVSDDAKLLAAKLIGDVTFTGRVEVWRFLMHYSSTAPWIGAGFQSFWQIGDLSPAQTEGSSWVVDAIYGHQGFLDTVVMIGYPGLALLLLFATMRPAFDLVRVERRRGPLLEMFVSFWLLGLFVNGTESSFLGRADPTWMFCVAGIVGIRRLALEGEAPSRRVTRGDDMAGLRAGAYARRVGASEAAPT